MSSRIVLAILSSVVASTMSLPLIDGSYLIERTPSFVHSSPLYSNLSDFCKAECEIVHQGGKYATKTVTYDQEIFFRDPSTGNGAAKTVSCGEAYTFQISYIDEFNLSLRPIDCKPLDSEIACNHDLWYVL